MQGSSCRASFCATSPIGPSTRWKRMSSRRTAKMRLTSSRSRKLSMALVLHRQHLLLELLDQRQIAVDDIVEDGVEQIIDAVHQQARRTFELFAQRGMRPGRAVADADDVAVADEDRGLAIIDMVLHHLRGAGDDEQLVAIDVDLGQLVGLERILDRQRMEIVAFLPAPASLPRSGRRCRSTRTRSCPAS